MKLFFLSLSMTLAISAKAQVMGVSLKASGLTCSMCSNAINKALKTLDFVDNVTANIKDYSFDISFKTGHDIDFDRIKKKVEDAGFSVSGFIATIQFPRLNINSGEAVTVDNKSFYFVKSPASLEGIQQVKIWNRGFVSAREYKSFNLPEKKLAAGVYYATL